MKPFKTQAYIYSLNKDKMNSTEMDEITVLEKRENDYIVDYKGIRCTAIFNPFIGKFYADTIFGVVPKQ